MKIGIVTTWFERGAAYVSKQFENILSKEYEVFIYARGGESYAIGNPNWDKPNVWWGKRKISPIHATYIDKSDFLQWIRKSGVEVIIFNEQHWFIPLLWCKRMNIKTLAYIDYYTKETVPLFDVYDGVICNTMRHYSAFKWHKHAIYLPWGTNIDLFKPMNGGLVKDGIVCYFHSAGMNAYRKGTDLFIRAYLKSNQKGKMIIHTQRDLKQQFPDLATDIDNLIKAKKLDLITGTIAAPGLYYRGDVYVYPSRLDGIGLTIAESLSSGLLCIVPNCGPMNEFVTSQCGYTVKVERYFEREDGYYWPMCEINVDQLAEIMNFLDENLNLVREMKLEARKHAEKNLSQEINFSKLNDIVRSIKFELLSNQTKNAILKYNKKGLGKFENAIMFFYPLLELARKVYKGYISYNRRLVE